MSTWTPCVRKASCRQMRSYEIDTMKLEKALELQNAFGYLHIAEVHALAALACLLPANPVVVNIGAGVGTSGLAFMEAREDLTLYTVEISPVSALGGLQNERIAFDAAGFGNSERHHQILGDSRTVEWPHGLVDMVLVDGDKDYHLDVPVWKPRIKKGGIMAFHDYGGPDWDHLRVIVDEAMQGHERFLWVDTLAAFRV